MNKRVRIITDRILLWLGYMPTPCDIAIYRESESVAHIVMGSVVIRAFIPEVGEQWQYRDRPTGNE